MTANATTALSGTTGLADPTLAFNLASPSDYSANSQFLNLMETMRPWVGHRPGQWGGMSIGALVEGGYLDKNGWPVAIPEGFASIGTLWEWDVTARNKIDKAGTYILTHKGRGKLRLSGNVRIVSSESGRIVFDTDGRTFYLAIEETDANDHVRDIAIVAEKHMALYEAGAIFDPDWLALIQDARALRFMDWAKTNNATVIDWADRRTAGMLGGLTKDRGVAVEYMVALCNQIGADPWFTMPHTASDAYVEAFATYVRDNLAPDRKVRVEYSNEAWNWAFTQPRWLSDRAQAEWGVGGGSVPGNYYVKRATTVAQIWRRVFGGNAHRVVAVLSGQTSNTWLTGEMLRADHWRRAEPENWIDPAQTFDEFGVTTYFGGLTVANKDLRQEFLEILASPTIDAGRWLAAKLSDPDYPDSVPGGIAVWKAQKALIAPAGLRLVSYEGGQHVHHSFAVEDLTQEQIDRMNGFLADFVRSEAMGTLYRQLWDAWMSVGEGPFMQYVETGAPSRWGSWGLYVGVSDTSPRAEALEALNATTAPWWTQAEPGTSYQQGLILKAGVMTGTPKVDYLLGGSADETLIGGGGDDGLHGGAGTDRVVLSGTPSEYTIIAEGDGHRLSGPDGHDLIRSVEELAFADGQVLTLQQMLERHGPQAETTIPKRGVLLDAKKKPVTIEPSEGRHLTVSGINLNSAVGKGLGNDTHYLIHEADATAQFDGRTVNADYWSLQENRATGTGPLLSDTAMETTLKLGSVITNAGKVTLTEDSDIFLGRERNDQIDGGAGDDYLDGGSGDDTLSAGDGKDALIGGSGSDLLIVSTGHTRIEDFTAEDRLDLSGFGAWNTLRHDLDGHGHLRLSNGTDTVTFVGRGEADLDWIGERV